MNGRAESQWGNQAKIKTPEGRMQTSAESPNIFYKRHHFEDEHREMTENLKKKRGSSGEDRMGSRLFIITSEFIKQYHLIHR